jgi:hypothetical protein
MHRFARDFSAAVPHGIAHRSNGIEINSSPPRIHVALIPQPFVIIDFSADKLRLEPPDNMRREIARAVLCIAGIADRINRLQPVSLGAVFGNNLYEYIVAVFRPFEPVRPRPGIGNRRPFDNTNLRSR